MAGYVCQEQRAAPLRMHVCYRHSAGAWVLPNADCAAGSLVATGSTASLAVGVLRLNSTWWGHSTRAEALRRITSSLKKTNVWSHVIVDRQPLERDCNAYYIATSVCHSKKLRKRHFHDFFVRDRVAPCRLACAILGGEDSPGSLKGCIAALVPSGMLPLASLLSRPMQVLHSATTTASRDFCAARVLTRVSERPRRVSRLQYMMGMPYQPRPLHMGLSLSHSPPALSPVSIMLR